MKPAKIRMRQMSSMTINLEGQLAWNIYDEASVARLFNNDKVMPRIRSYIKKKTFLADYG
jgi:hypothetical protein